MSSNRDGYRPLTTGEIDVAYPIHKPNTIRILALGLVCNYKGIILMQHFLDYPPYVTLPTPQCIYLNNQLEAS